MTTFLPLILLAAVAVASVAVEIPQKNEPHDVLISFSSGRPVSTILTELKTSTAALGRTQRLHTIATVLKQNAAESHAPVLDWLTGNRDQHASVDKVQSLWLTNQILIRGATTELLAQLTANFPQISSVEEDRALPREVDEVPTALPGSRPTELAEWGVENVRAPAVWFAPGGNQGEGVIVASIDTGVRGTHETLRDNWLGGVAGWLDPFESSTEPSDIIGQGTHAMGTMVGSSGTGVAPGAKWAACRGCEFTCPFSMLLACGEFFLCPNPEDECSLAPHLITNGWRAMRGDHSYDDVIQAWRLGGIIPVFTNGNVGPDCGSAASPGDSEHGVITVSLSTPNDTLADRSSKGPASNGLIKPDVVAPGELIVSASHLSDTGYSLLSGVAQPHVGGTIALLLSYNPAFTFGHVQKLLTDGAGKWLPQTGYNCGGIPENVYPNHAVGHGKVDAFGSFMLALSRP